MITLFEADTESKNYKKRSTTSTLGENFTGESVCADIHLSPDGRFLYGSNRGENTIVIFAITKDTGELKLVGREKVRGDWPRNFAIDPTGNNPVCLAFVR